MYKFLFQFLLAASILATASAATTPLYATQAATYKKFPPKPFAYEYVVADDYSKNNYKKTETQDAEGKVEGSFTISLPDGRVQIISYTVDGDHGFVADVTYEGTAVYPPEPKEGYGHRNTEYRATGGARV